MRTSTPDAGERHHDVAEQDRGVDLHPAERLQRHLDHLRGVPARVQDVALAAQLAVLRQVSARLAHEPHGGAVHRQPAAGAQEPIGRRGRAHTLQSTERHDVDPVRLPWNADADEEANAMTGRLEGKRVVVLLAEGFEDLEFHVPLMRLQEEGADVTVAGPTTEVVRGKHGLEARADTTVSDLPDPGGFDAVVVPGGWAPDKLRRYDEVKELVRVERTSAARSWGLICHAGSVGISAGIVAGGRATGSLGIKDDLVNAGATWVDEPAFRDGTIVWGRVVEDIPDFCRELVAAIEAG